MAEQWFRHKWLDAIYASELDPIARHVAEIFAGKARQDSIAWEPLTNLVMKTGRTKTTCSKARQALVDGGWLTEVKAPTHKAAAHFLLVIPGAEGSSQWTPEDDGGVQPLDLRGLATGPQGSSEETPRGLATGPSQSVVNPDQSISLSPEQLLVRDLLGLDDGDERLMKISSILTANNVRNPKVWLRSCHANGDLLDLLQAETTTSSTWGTDTTDDGLMDNPHYVEGWDMKSRIKPEDYYRPRMSRELIADPDEIDGEVDNARRSFPGHSEERIWKEAWMVLHHDLVCKVCHRGGHLHETSCRFSTQAQAS